MTRLARAFLCGLILLWPAALSAQTTEEIADDIGAVVTRIERMRDAGDLAGALDAALALKMQTDEQADRLQGHPMRWAPDLVAARTAWIAGDYALARNLAAPIVEVLDTPETRSSNARLEASLLVAMALYRQRDYLGLEPVLRSFLRDADRGAPDPAWVTQGAYMLAHAATLNGATDADRLRRDLLDGFGARAGATRTMLVRLLMRDLDARREGGDKVDALSRDAVALDTLLKAEIDTLPTTLFWLAKGSVGRALVEAGDFDAARRIYTDRLAHLSRQTPDHPDRFWAWQNLISLHNRTGDIRAARQEAEAALAELRVLGASSRHARATSMIERELYLAARALGDRQAAHDAYLRAYAALREVDQPNTPEVVALRVEMPDDLVAPPDYAHTAELGLAAGEGLELRPDGSAVVEAFFYGRYVETGAALDRLDREGADPHLLALNRAIHFALLGDVHLTLRYAAEAEATDPNAGRKGVKTSPFVLIARAMAQAYASEGDPASADSALAELEARMDLPPILRGLAVSMRMSYGAFTDNSDLTRQLVADRMDDLRPLADTSPWGLLLGLGLLDHGFRHGRQPPAREFYDAYKALILKERPDSLARTFIETFRFAAEPLAMSNDTRFRRMPAHLARLDQGLPRAHYWRVSSYAAFAQAVMQRQDYQNAALLFQDLADSYRLADVVREDVLSYFEIERGWALFHSGDTFTAHRIMREVYDRADPETWRGIYWVRAVQSRAQSLFWQNRLVEARRVLDRAIAVPVVEDRLSPVEQMELYTMRADLYLLVHDLDRAIADYDRAIEIVPFERYQQGWPLANALHQRASAFYRTERLRLAYRDVRRGNKLWFETFESLFGAADVARFSDDDRNRAINEATYGWGLAQALKEADH